MFSHGFAVSNHWKVAHASRLLFSAATSGTLVLLSRWMPALLFKRSQRLDALEDGRMGIFQEYLQRMGRQIGEVVDR